MACQGKCIGAILYPMLCTHTVPLGSVLPFCLHLYHVFSVSHRLALTLRLCCLYNYKSYLSKYIKIPIRSIVYQSANTQNFEAKVPAIS